MHCKFTTIHTRHTHTVMSGRKHGLPESDEKPVKRARTDAASIEAKRASVGALAAKLRAQKAAKAKDNSDAKSVALAESAKDRLARIKAKTAEIKRQKEEREEKLRQDRLKKPQKDMRNTKTNRHTPTPTIGIDTDVHPLLLEIKEQQQKPNPYLDHSAQNLKDGFFDPNVELPRARKPRALQFSEPGKYIAQGEEMRYEMEMQRMQRRLEEEAEEKRRKRETGISVDERKYKRDVPPDTEWWDVPYLQQQQKEGVDGESGDKQLVDLDAADSPVTLYVQHPILVPAPWEKHLPQGPLPLHLTKREQKRIRKQSRAEKHKDQQDRIRLGLDPAPPPKVKLSNIMSVMSAESMRDPTQVEMEVRRAVQERQLTHEQNNHDRKLTKEDRAQKIKDKAERDKATKGVFTAVFRIETLADDQHRYKVNVNARQLHLTGITLLNPAFCLVVVEGSPRDVLRYKKLLLRRIQWTEAAPLREEDEGKVLPNLGSNRCTLVWEGQLMDQQFKRWTTESAEDEVSAVDLLRRNGAESYWIKAKGVVVE